MDPSLSRRTIDNPDGLSTNIGINVEPLRGSIHAYLFFVAPGESFFSPSTTFLFRGNGLCTKVHSCLWNSHSTQSAAPSCITHRLFLRRQASQGRSLLVRMLATGPAVDDTGLPATWLSTTGEECCFLGRAAAMGTGTGRGMAGCIARAVVISPADVFLRDKDC